MFGACFYWVTMFMLYLAQPEPGLAVPMQRTVVERTRPVPNPVPREAKSVARSSHAAREVRAPLWTPVIEGVLLAYNAYWDVRAIQGMEPPFIRVLTTALDYGEAQRDHFQDYAGRFDESGFQCRLHFSSSSRKDELVPAVLHAHTTYDGTASFDILCHVRSALAASSRRQLPRAVSLACTECTQPWAIEVEYREHALRVLKAGRSSKASAVSSTEQQQQQEAAEGEEVLPNGLAICVRPTYGPYDDVGSVLEFITYYLAMGADCLTFFTNRGMAPSVVLLLRKAMELGLPVEVLPWTYHVPSSRGNTVHEYNQHLATTACSYRHLHLSRHVAMVDFDEFIVPRPPHTSLPGLLASLDVQHPKASGFQFLNSFFFPKFGPDPSLSHVALPFRVLHYTERMPEYPPGNRSKSIVKPARVVWTNIHGTRPGVGLPVPGYEEVVVPPEQALLQHYRSEFPSGRTMMPIDTVINVKTRASRDDAALRFRERLEAWPHLKTLLDFVEELEHVDDVA